MNKQRNYREFTPDELKTIASYNGKTSLMGLSKIMGINYTNFTSAIRQHRVPFESKKEPSTTPVIKMSSALLNKTNKEGEDILTDEMMKRFSYM